MTTMTMDTHEQADEQRLWLCELCQTEYPTLTDGCWLGEHWQYWQDRRTVPQGA